MWEALTSEHSEYALRNELAARYRADISPLAGLAERSGEALLALSELMQPGEIVATFDPVDLPADRVEAVASVPLTQWVCETLLPQPGRAEPELTELGAAHAQQMYDLAKLTDPGPFEANTWRLGRYIGVLVDGELVAMAGERMCLNGFREVSAVCTAPGHGGNGYARALVAAVAHQQLADGSRPFLHVRVGSPSEAAASGIYAKLGFVERWRMNMVVLRRL